MCRIVAAALILALTSVASAEDAKFKVKVEDTEAPKELSDAIRAVLSTKSLTVLDEKGKLLCTVWTVKGLEAKADADVTGGAKYVHLEETTLVGAVKFHDTWIDYRKQKIKAGVYTLRYAVQLMDGDHMGTAPYSDFCLLSLAADDKKPDLMDVKDLYEHSSKASPRKHPALMLLFPNRKPTDAPQIEAKPRDHFVLSFRIPVKAGEAKVDLGFSLVVVGVTDAE